MLHLKTPDEIDLLRKAGRVVADILDHIGTVVRPGVSTGELDRIADEHISACGGTAAFKGYRMTGRTPPFPGIVCASINDEIVHGIPSDERKLEEGDILSIDVGVCLNGYFGDAACTYPVGAISPERQKLLEVTETSLNRAIEAARVGKTVGDIGYAVESYAVPLKYGIVRDYTGHGVGQKLHEAPQVPNFGRPGRGVMLQKGMTLAIEPMIMSGREAVRVGENGWTVLTADGSDAAHFERSIVILDDGPEILTPWTSRMGR